MRALVRSGDAEKIVFFASALSIGEGSNKFHEEDGPASFRESLCRSEHTCT